MQSLANNQSIDSAPPSSSVPLPAPSQKESEQQYFQSQQQLGALQCANCGTTTTPFGEEPTMVNHSATPVVFIRSYTMHQDQYT